MKTIIYALFILCCSYALFGQNLPTDYTTAQISTINTNTDASEGDLYRDYQQNLYYIGATDGSLIPLSASSGWQINGNTGNTSANFLGNIDDVRMQIRSNNLPLLEFGRRQTLGLTQNFVDYTDNNQPLVHVNGDGTTSALQFAASAASFYKPMFFTTTNGSFRLKGSSGGTDFFEIGSAGPGNDGRLEFIIGDDGSEPIIFKRFDYRNGNFHTELFRVQGSSNSANAKPRFGININPQQVAIDTDYDDASAGFNMANSTFQVNGSVSKSILETTANLTLTEDHHTVLLGGNHTLTLPNANSCEGRVYIIKNANNFATPISQYINTEGVNNIQTVNQNSVLWLQSDGTNWQQINNTASAGYEKIVIWAEEGSSLANNQLEWSFGNNDSGEIGIPLAEDWEAYAVSFNADIASSGSTVEIAIINSANNTNLFTFTASGDTNNMVYTEILTTPVAIAAGTSIGFRTVDETGSISSARVAVFLRRKP